MAGFYLGCDIGPGPSFAGMLDEITLYSKALTNTEIYYIYSAGSAGKNSTKPYFITPAILPNAQRGANYTAQNVRITTQFGVLPVSFSLSKGSMPDDLLITSSGSIQGTVPLSASTGTFSFTIRATDSTGLYSEQLYTITVN